MYLARPFNENICMRTGKVVPHMAQRDCFVTEILKPKETKMEKNTNTKVCKECGRELPIEQFRPNHKSPDGHLNTCKECMAKKVSKTMKEKHKTEDEQLLDDISGNVDTEEVSESIEEEFARAEKTISSADDIDLVFELRARGWEVTCKRTMIIEL